MTDGDKIGKRDETLLPPSHTTTVTFTPWGDPQDKGNSYDLCRRGSKSSPLNQNPLSRARPRPLSSGRKSRCTFSVLGLASMVHSMTVDATEKDRRCSTWRVNFSLSGEELARPTRIVIFCFVRLHVSCFRSVNANVPITAQLRFIINK